METLILVGVLLGGVAAYALAAVYAERKVSAFIQDRLGPMEVGPYGLFQTVADIIKLLLKERIIPAAADVKLFLLAPLVVYAAVFAGFAVIPFGPSWIGSAANIGVLYVIAIVSIDVIGILMAGWGSNNKYALLGSMRAVSQIISYEIPAGLAILSAVLMYGSLQLNEISFQQSPYAAQPVYFLGLWDVTEFGGITTWGVIRYPHLWLAFVVYFIAGMAECNRAPFDIPEAESELVAGFHVEYSGFNFAVLFLAEYANMLLVSMIAVLLFFGGWSSPLPNVIGGSPEPTIWGQLIHLQGAYLTSGQPGTVMAGLWGCFWLISKALVLVLVMMWVRWTLPRLRADQLMIICWKYLTPAAFLAVILSLILKLLERYYQLGLL